MGPETSDVSERSFARLTDEHLSHLVDIAHDDMRDRFSRRPRWAVYWDRVLLVALCQGAALHYLDGRNGVRDLAVWTFFARHPEGEFPPRWRRMSDFGASSLGRGPEDVEFGFQGRHVDLIGRSLDVSAAIPEPVSAVRSYLRAGRTRSARELAAKAVVALDPPELLGTVVWPEAVGNTALVSRRSVGWPS